MALETVDYQLSKWSEMWLYKSVEPFGLIPSTCVWAGPQSCVWESSGWATALVISGSLSPLLCCPLNMSWHTGSSLQELQNEQPASPKLGSQISSAACSAVLDSEMCLSKFCGDLGLCGEISVADVSGPQQLRTAICSLTQCLFSRDFLEGELWF